MNNFISAFTGEVIDEILLSVKGVSNPTRIQSSDNLNNYKTPGVYTCNSGADAALIGNSPITSGGYVLIVLRLSSSNPSVINQIVMGNYDGGIFIRKTYWNGTTYAFNPWNKVIMLRQILESKRSGTTAERPVVSSIDSTQRPNWVGFCYIDTDLGKPIFYTGDTSDGKSGWVDATGASV